MMLQSQLSSQICRYRFSTQNFTLDLLCITELKTVFRNIFEVQILYQQQKQKETDL